MDKDESVSDVMHLSGVPLFRSLPADEIAGLLERYRTWNAPAGALVLQEGQPGEEFYVILSGQVEIIRALGSAEESHLGLRRAGEFIGEIGLLNPLAPRSATARVAAEACLLVVTYADFHRLLQRHPELAYELASVLAARIAETMEETIRHLRGKNEELQRAYDELKAAQAQIVEKEKLEHSLQVARQIQYSILPAVIPQMEGYDIGALMTPAQAVGGDFYGVYPLDEENLALIVGDVSDKGMPAAIFMAQSHALLRAAIHRDAGPTASIERVNELLLEMNAEDMFVTVLYGILNRASGEFRYVRAGHEQPLLLGPAGEVSFPEQGRGMALGLFADLSLVEHCLTVPAGGLLLLYSDGVTDDLNRDGSVHFGRDGLAQIVRRVGGGVPAQHACQAILDALIAFQGGAAQFDDITLLAVRRLIG